MTRRGFSLIEVMVTSLVLGLGVVGLASMYTSTARGVGSSRHRETAVQIAAQRIERLTTSTTDSLPDCGGVVGCRATPDTLAPELGPASGFNCTQYVSDMGSNEPSAADALGGYRLDTIVAPHPSATQGADARLISVSVCWTDASGLIQQVMMQRLALGDG